jgi:uncharacterized protein YecA (UPF0149 family)
MRRTYEEVLKSCKYYREGDEEGRKKRTVKTRKQPEVSAKPRKVGRNEPCPCGSGKKFKKCCLRSGVAV